MRILLATNHLFANTGSELTIATLAGALVSAGHSVLIFALFENRQFVRGSLLGGLECTTDIEKVKTFNPEAAYTQHHPVAVTIRAALPKCPVLHAILGVLPFLEKPLAVELGINRYLAISEEVASSLLKAGIPQKQIHLFRNVISDHRFYNDKKPISETPRRLVVFSYKLDERKLQAIASVCKSRDIEILDDTPPRPGATDYTEVPSKLRAGDIVITSGRGAIEAMMCGCVPLIMADCGDDGLVTPENFKKIMRFNFSGRATKRSFTEVELAVEIDNYSASNIPKLHDLSHQFFAVSRRLGQLEKLLSEVIMEGAGQLSKNDLKHAKFLAESYAMIKKFSRINSWDASPASSGNPADADKVDKLRDAAMADIEQGNWKQALVGLKKAHRLRPSGPFIRLQLARVLLELGRAEEALPHLDAVAAIPGFPSRYPLLSTLQVRAKAAASGSPFVEIRSLNDKQFEIGDIRYLNALDDYSARTTPEEVVILKPVETLEFYRDYFLPRNVRNVLEFGIWQGGTPIALTQLLRLETYVGIDREPPLEILDALIRKKGLDSRISLHYQTSQSDVPAVRDIIKAHFAENTLDLIIDDASHHYEHSVRSFEAAYPYLKPGGSYVIEDWGWSHWPGSEEFAQKKAHLKSFSNLVFELTMACASTRGGIERVLVTPMMVIVQKAGNAKRIDPEGFTLASLYTVHGRTFNYL